ncbi:proteasome inhibitor PI31 subunit [Anabrus simplex]|uniref:proteasome inhibitor PI31 subunit n=1 Tax=Anabrus simplex TaxID=316456 RepID=UPI0034DDC18D
MASDMFGWDLVYKLAEKDITKKEDVLVVLIHWFLLKNGFKCVGIGDNKVLLESEVGSETLPEGWNAEDTYALRYAHNKRLFILRGVRTEGDIIFNLLRVSDLSVSNVSFAVDDTVRNLSGPIENLIPSYTDVLYNIQKDLIDPVFSGKKRTATTQTAEGESSRANEPTAPRFRYEDDPLRVPRRDVDPGFGSNWDPHGDPLAIGRSDLDPFARGGGMLFNPFGPRGGVRQPPDIGGVPGGLPRGSIPPGARFDPFGPPGVGPGIGPGRGGHRGFAPDPDHLPPPGYDDMFM